MVSKKSNTNIDRQGMIAEAAYYLAEKRGFSGDEREQDWLQAELEVDRLIAASQIVQPPKKVANRRKTSTQS